MSSHKAFTLLEILLVIAAIGILAAIVIVAINPQRQLQQAQNAQITSHSREINQALQQYLIDQGGVLPPNTVAPISTSVPQQICKADVDPSVCEAEELILLADLIPTYLASIPTHPTQATEEGSGYWVMQNETGKLAILTTDEVDELPSIATQEYPASLDNLSLWLSARYGVIDDGSGRIEEWQDQSGNDNNAYQSTQSRRPLIVEEDDLPRVRFTGLNNQILTVDDAPELDGTTQLQIFLVMRDNFASENPRGILSKRTSQTTNRAYSVFSWEFNQYYFDFNITRSSISAPPINQIFLLELEFDGSRNSNQRLRRRINNNTSSFSEADSIIANTPAPLYIGQLNEGYGDVLNADLLEIIILRDNLTEPENTELREYLNNIYSMY